MTNEDIYRKAIEIFGAYAQTVVAIEELSELQKELCKAIRTGIGDPKNRDHIAEEIADVYIMLEQMENLFDVSEDVPLYRIAKIDRLERRLKEKTK